VLPIARAVFPTHADTSDVHMRLRNLRAGMVVTLLCAAVFAGYDLLTWTRPHRTAMLALTLATLLVVGAFARVPLAELMRRPRLSELFFVSWSGTLIGAISVMVVLDRGADSPLAVSYFLPLAFAALSYPVASMVAVGGLAVAAYAAVAAGAGDVPAAHVTFVAVALACATWMSAWQARNHERQRRELARVSRADPLTGALNRRGFDERFAGELARARRSAAPLALIVLDLDDFKRTNDRHGHAAGDELLRRTVERLSAALRTEDAVARLGGDEFAVLAPGAGPAAAAQLAARLVERLRAGAPASAGVATFPVDGLDAAALHQVADLDLYAVKHGRAARALAGGPRELSWAAALARSVDERLGAAHDRSASVGRHAHAIAERLGLDADHAGAVRLAGVLSDVGKIAVPEELLRAREPLDPAERDLLRRHPAAGADLVARIEGMQGVAAWIRHSHEDVDGTGYPDGLAGEEIPLESRILHVADAFEELTGVGVDRVPLPVDDALVHLRRLAGTRYDEACVEALAAVLDAPAALPAAADALGDLVGLG
jgi:diguanylate cyclase (GGDEF)-like protein